MYRKKSWWLQVRIPFVDVAQFLTEEEYERYKEKFYDLEIDINLIVSPKDPDVGIPTETITYEGQWAVPMCGNYPDRIKDAIEEYLCSINVEETYQRKLYELMDSYR